mmetsp:Transcript_158859/g.505825  ORF Transcript_158859/g.505825 Transcript_158859/m.505825 type:complete len:366 (+) Transcript_158859:167-1264(+)
MTSLSSFAFRVVRIWTSWLVWSAVAIVQCQLESLHLRFNSKPVDLAPVFQPSTFVYSATLDWAMDAFSVDAVAHPGCEADKVPFRAISVPKGETYQITIFAKAQNSTVTQAYAIRVKRLDGTETELKTLRILGAQLSPEFNGGLREYTATMVVALEFVNVAYVLLDAGQKVHITAAAQTGSGGNVSRRLQMLGEQLQAGAQTARVTGEVQDFERTQLFPIDQGHSRRWHIHCDCFARGLHRCETSIRPSLAELCRKLWGWLLREQRIEPMFEMQRQLCGVCRSVEMRTLSAGHSALELHNSARWQLLGSAKHLVGQVLLVVHQLGDFCSRLALYVDWCAVPIHLHLLLLSRTGQVWLRHRFRSRN